MIVDRRNFIRVTSAALIGITINPLSAVVTNDDLYINKALGLAFYKPKGWYFINIEEFGELTKKISLSDKWKDVEQYVWKNTGSPICIISKYDQNDELKIGKYSPSIAVWVESKQDYKNYDFQSLDIFSHTMIYRRMGYVENPKIINKKNEYKINNVSIIEYDWEFTQKHVDLPKPITTQVKMIFAEHGSYYYTFDLVDSLEANEFAGNEFRSFIEKILLM